MNINCPHFDQCSGCHHNINVSNIDIFSEAKVFFKERGVDLPPLITGSPVGWRTRAKLAVRGDFLNPQIGLFEEGSHRIVDIPLCRVHHPSINIVVEKLKNWIKKERIKTYRETQKDGLLRYVQCSIERSTGRVQVVLVINGPTQSLKNKLLEFYDEEKDLLHSLWVNVNQRPDNVIFGDRWDLIAGEEFLWEVLFGGTSVCFHPACFCQANIDMYEKLIEHLQMQISPQASVLEMYAGVGAIGLCLVNKVASVCCVEITPEARLCFENSLHRLSDENKAKISLHVSAASSQINLLNTLKPTVLIVDPPRKGLDLTLIDAVCDATSLERIAYVSCGWPSFKRDCDLLISKGWKPSFAEAFLFFPGTNHLELLCFFNRL